MISIGERINGMFSDVKRAIADEDKNVIQDLAARQTAAGASYLDVNVGTAAADQEATMAWLVETIQQTCKTPLCLDSQKPNVIAAGLKAADTSMGILLNSSPLNKKTDEEVLDKYLEMAESAGPGGKLIALTMDKNGVPQDIDTRVAIAAEIIEKTMEKGFDSDRLFIDPIILPVKVPDALGSAPSYHMRFIQYFPGISRAQSDQSDFHGDGHVPRDGFGHRRCAG